MIENYIYKVWSNYKTTVLKKNSKQKISFIIGSFNIGGTERHFLNLINRLDPLKYCIDIHLLKEKGILFDETLWDLGALSASFLQ